jgi:hypothetical protein
MKSEPFKVNNSSINESSKCKSIVGTHREQILQLSQSEVNFVNT